MRILSTRSGSFGFGLAMSLAIALPVLAQLYSTPGYEYGRANCGPRTSNNTTAAQCKVCCLLGESGSAFPVGEYSNCEAFCDRALWPT
ncbi:MAG: hypothetical protein JNK58_01985 [Phycisphaerae bacterium]|nr:hypothetical protein [Phycisphaerae bacterium]